MIQDPPDALRAPSAGPTDTTAGVPGRRPPAVTVGVNLPWLQYGCDFGLNAWQPEGGVALPARRRKLADIFSRLADHGLSLVRWFMLCDGRAGLRFSDEGVALGLDDRMAADGDAAVEVAEDRGIRLVFVLLDFHWLKPRRVVQGAVLGGRRRSISDTHHRTALLELVVAPILRRYGRHRAVAAWDLINEPEWATLGIGCLDPRGGVLPGTMRAFIGEGVALIHAEATQPATVGLASARGLSLVRHAGLDIRQVHWYDRRQRRAPLERPIASATGGPVWLGEFPTNGSTRSVSAILDTAAAAGYTHALAWSAASHDRWSDLDALVRAVDARPG